MKISLAGDWTGQELSNCPPMSKNESQRGPSPAKSTGNLDYSIALTYAEVIAGPMFTLISTGP